MQNIQMYSDIDALASAAADDFIETVEMAVHRCGQAAVALSGGSTPQKLYTLLASETYSQRLNWERVHLFWGDERCVPPDHQDSNFYHARLALLDHIPIPAANIHRIHAELEPQAAAESYQQELRMFFMTAEGPPPPRTFDLVLLGLGADAHTASLFPGSAVLAETQRWVSAHFVDSLSAWRITMTAPLLNSAARVRFLVSGAEKRWAVKKVLYGASQPERYPAQLIQPVSGDVGWLLDESAAGPL